MPDQLVESAKPIFGKLKMQPVDDDITPKDLADVLVAYDELMGNNLIGYFSMIGQMESESNEIEPQEMYGGDEYVLDVISRMITLTNTIDETCYGTLGLMKMVSKYTTQFKID